MTQQKPYFKSLLLALVATFASYATGGCSPTIGSISVRAELNPEHVKAVMATMEKGLALAKNRADEGWYFPINKPEQYHLTLLALEGKEGTPLKKEDSDQVWSQGGRHLNKNLALYNTTGHLYGLYLLAHGYDASGKALHLHYSSPQAAKDDLPNYLGGHSGNRLTHVHFVAKYGGSHTGGPLS